MHKVLIVEDNEMNMNMLSRRLERKGFEVFGTINGEETLAELSRINPDVILMDINLPDIDGVALMKEIRPLVNNTPIFAITAHAMDGDEERFLNEGFCGYESKPVQLGRLILKITNAIENRSKL